MAKSKSVRVQLSEGTVKVEHEHVTKMVKLPDWLQVRPDILDSEEELVEHLRQHNALLPVLQAGLAQSLINYRAHTRQFNAKKEPVIIENVQWQPSLLPNPGKSKAEKALEDMSPEQLQELLKRKGLA